MAAELNFQNIDLYTMIAIIYSRVAKPTYFHFTFFSLR